MRLVLNGDAGTLYADVVSKSLSSGELEEFPGVDLASLNLTGITPAVSGDVLTWTGIPAVLTENGAPAFAGFYAAGTALDPVSIAATFEEPPPASVDPASLDFGTQGLGSLSPSRTVTVTAGADPLAIDRLTTTGDHLEDFLVAGDTCSGAALAPGEECSFRVRFAPGAETVRQATISVLSDAPEGPLEVALSGTGSPLGQGPQGEPGVPGEPGAGGAQGPAGRRRPRPRGRAGPRRRAGRPRPQGRAWPARPRCLRHMPAREPAGRPAGRLPGGPPRHRPRLALPGAPDPARQGLRLRHRAPPAGRPARAARQLRPPPRHRQPRTRPEGDRALT